ncbi:hypothetical protein, partial [Alicyclobacillus sendaiensis]|uniref:hypothetical protein n=1 Tax=Alicyclobacillus sendaiensis TaxID=192387 RepID=UPI0026F44249
GSDSSLAKTLEFGLYLDQEEAKGFYTSNEWKSLNMPNFASVSPLVVGVGNLLLVYSPGQQLVGVYNAQTNALVYTGNFTSIPAIASTLSQNTAVEALAFGVGQ